VNIRKYYVDNLKFWDNNHRNYHECTSMINTAPRAYQIWIIITFEREL